MATNGDQVTSRDYYIDNGYVVFTREFLLRRGKCCDSGCRHCPYREAKVEVPPAVDSLPEQPETRSVG